MKESPTMVLKLLPEEYNFYIRTKWGCKFAGIKPGKHVPFRPKTINSLPNAGTLQQYPQLGP